MKRQLINSAAVFLRYSPGGAVPGRAVPEPAGKALRYCDGFLAGAKLYLPYFIRGGDDVCG